jgi:hypothetical protein
MKSDCNGVVVKRPLYVVGVGEIGTDLERKLKQIFDIACVWKAIVLIGKLTFLICCHIIHR